MPYSQNTEVDWINEHIQVGIYKVYPTYLIWVSGGCLSTQYDTTRLDIYYKRVTSHISQPTRVIQYIGILTPRKEIFGHPF